MQNSRRQSNYCLVIQSIFYTILRLLHMAWFCYFYTIEIYESTLFKHCVVLVYGKECSAELDKYLNYPPTESKIKKAKLQRDL